jgi:hypothetical protein
MQGGGRFVRFVSGVAGARLRASKGWRQIFKSAASGARKHPISRIRIGASAMTTFDKREEGFEQEFAHDEALRFKATARRDKMLGLWAAQKLGLAGAAAEQYATALVTAEVEQGGSAVERKIRQDFDAKGVIVSDHQISRTMNELMAQAISDIKAGK